jgi:hypothetical protein
MLVVFSLIYQPVAVYWKRDCALNLLSENYKWIYFLFILWKNSRLAFWKEAIGTTSLICNVGFLWIGVLTRLFWLQKVVEILFIFSVCWYGTLLQCWIHSDTISIFYLFYFIFYIEDMAWLCLLIKLALKLP